MARPRGDPERGFEAYAHACQQHLFRTAYMLCADRDDAQDLVQTTLLKLYRYWPRVVRADNLDAYVRKVLIRGFLEQRRRSRREQQALLLMDPEPAPHDADLRVTVLQALASLPPKPRAMVVLRYWEDQSVEMVAEVLGCSAGNVKSQCSRALDKLRPLLQDVSHQLTD